MRPAIPQPWIQIAGVSDAAEAELLLAAGVAWLGFPLRLGYHRPDLDEAAAAALIRHLPAAAVPVLITYQTDGRGIAEFATALGAKAVQAHGEITAAEFARLRGLRPDLFLIKSLIVRGSDPAPLLAAARPFEPAADAFITDSFDPATGACGATGRTHDWTVSHTLARELRRPLILAGGLTPENVAAAIRAVRPAGVDAHTGVEGADGRKEAGRVRAFVAAASATFAAIPEAMAGVDAHPRP
ncbi:MAG: phosphoribosylanthranilate isomerase [Lentisphaeria bacterium]|jgi:phosphoribosylanthranilate isomerase